MKKGRKETTVKIKAYRIKEKMIKEKITQKQLAKELSYARQTINKALNDEKIDLSLLDKIARYLDLDPEYIKGENEKHMNDLLTKEEQKLLSKEMINIFYDSKGFFIFPYPIKASIDSLENDFKAWCSYAIMYELKYKTIPSNINFDDLYKKTLDFINNYIKSKTKGK